MADVTAGAIETPELRREYFSLLRRKRLYSTLMLALFVLLMVSGFRVANDRNAGGFFDGFHRILDYPEQILGEAAQKLALIPAHMVTYFPSLIETINIAAVSTLLGVLFGSILSLLATRGLAAFPRFIPVFRRLMDIMRAMPEIVLALVLIFILGGGPVPAMIAIAFHTTGAIGKLYSEVNENADLKPVDGLASVGANWTQKMWFGVVPQVAPNYLSYALLRFEINIRASAILGFVGAGGIGYELKNAITWGKGKYDETAAIFILLFISIVFFDQLSSRVRNRLTEGANQ